MKAKKSVFSPTMLKVQRTLKLNDDIKDTERANPGMSKGLKEKIENFTEEKLKKRAVETVKRYFSEAIAVGPFDFLIEDAYEEDRISLRYDRAKFKRSQKC